PICCAPPVLIVMLQPVSPAAPNPAPPSGLLAKCTTLASPSAPTTPRTTTSCATLTDSDSLTSITRTNRGRRSAARLLTNDEARTNSEAARSIAQAINSFERGPNDQFIGLN